MFKCKVPNEKGKGNDLVRVCKPLLGSKAKPLPPKQSGKVKWKMWSEITKKCLDASSQSEPPLHHCIYYLHTQINADLQN